MGPVQKPPLTSFLFPGAHFLSCSAHSISPPFGLCVFPSVSGRLTRQPLPHQEAKVLELVITGFPVKAKSQPWGAGGAGGRQGPRARLTSSRPVASAGPARRCRHGASSSPGRGACCLHGPTGKPRARSPEHPATPASPQMPHSQLRSAISSLSPSSLPSTLPEPVPPGLSISSQRQPAAEATDHTSPPPANRSLPELPHLKEDICRILYHGSEGLLGPSP
ncbi:translation initiation factor IF-2-like [Meles meles]|uniref:translation initiation factor IF-2-like n=1 Tax=Meles meles TaxID=9662 RepID=UPI001E69B20A|nr:translation initiation factor IF-2-like [Meles meles]